jgi:triacylglycerol lipase
MRNISTASRARRRFTPKLLLSCLLVASGCSTALSIGAIAGDKKVFEQFQGSELRPVVLLHGWGRSERAMWLMKRRFTDAGFAAHAIGYDSRDQSIKQIVAQVDAAIDACCAGLGQINFVTHSLGGIILRAWAEENGSERIARAVMLSPPNHGSAIIDMLGSLRAVLGPAGSDLGAHDDSAPNRLNALGPVKFELGVIAGDRSMNPIGSWILDGPDDGTVSVDSARVEGMKDFLVMSATHSFMNYDEDVALQAVRFMDTGAFSRATNEGDGVEANGTNSINEEGDQ